MYIWRLFAHLSCFQSSKPLWRDAMPAKMWSYIWSPPYDPWRRCKPLWQLICGHKCCWYQNIRVGSPPPTEGCLTNMTLFHTQEKCPVCLVALTFHVLFASSMECLGALWLGWVGRKWLLNTHCLPPAFTFWRCTINKSLKDLPLYIYRSATIIAVWQSRFLLLRLNLICRPGHVTVEPNNYILSWISVQSFWLS